jgi:drug/metabolite transporter (DMT)-like permease
LSTPDTFLSDRSRGIIFILISGFCWGFHGILIKFALGFGVSFLQVFFFEVVFATLFFGGFAGSFLKTIRPTQKKHWVNLLAVGSSSIGVGYFLFLSFSLGPVAIGATFMFMYLPVVYGYSLLKKHQTLSLTKVGSISLVLLGAVLTTEIMQSFKEPGALPAAFTAIFASMCYALVFILTPGTAAYTTAEFRSFAVSGIGLIGCLVIFAFIPSLWFPIDHNLWQLAGVAVLLGAIGQTLPIITLMKGIPLTGASLAGVLAAVELPIAVFSAAILLGESLNLLKLVGVGLVLSGIVLYNLSDRKRA